MRFLPVAIAAMAAVSLAVVCEVVPVPHLYSEGVAEAADAPSAPLREGRVAQAPQTFGNLTVFPITSSSQTDVGPMTTLDSALAAKTAEVREVGAGGGQNARVGAQVNTLVIDNRGTVPIYVLAGTIVKGGNQDREIGQDFIIPEKHVVSIDAFCVEHGRWEASRGGAPTQGKFGTMQQLAHSEVRAAAQYKQDQGEVWSKVAAVNAAHKKAPATATLMATLDDGEVAAKRAAMAAKVNALLTSVQPNPDVVGFAYAVDGKVRGARWFAHHRVFELYRSTLVNTAAVDAIAASSSSASPAASPAVTPADVARFITTVQDAKVSAEKATAAGNVNQFRESAAAYGSRTMMKPAAPKAAPVPVSSDFVAK